MDDSFLNVGYFHLARSISKYSNHRVKVGAVISNHKPIVMTCNKMRTHPIHANPDKTKIGSIHAEIRAVIYAGKDSLRGYDIYVYRETKDGRPALARPCEYCMGVLEEVGIKKVYYTVPYEPYWRMEYI